MENQNIFQISDVRGIPLKPKIPLTNYFFDLVSKSDDKESSLYLKRVEKFIQEIWAEIIKNRILHVRKFIPNNLGVSSIYPYKSGKKGISIQNLYKLLCLWKKYCDRDNKTLERKWNKIYKSDFIISSHKSCGTSLPKFISPKLSYLLGWLCGDGHIEDRWGHYLIKISEKSTNQLNFVLSPLFKELFDVSAPIFRIYKGGHALQIGNKAILRFLKCVFGIKIGQIPVIAKNLDPINKKYFLMGIFDSEGSVDYSYSNARILIHQADCKFLNTVARLSEDMGVKFTGPYRCQNKNGVWYQIQIRRRADILQIIKKIGTYHVDKFPKIKILEEKLYAHGYRHSSA